MSQGNYIATKLKSDSLWVACGFAINALSSLVISMLLTRILDTNSVGVYFLAFSISIMLSSIIQFGFNITVVKLISSAETSGGAQDLRLLLLKILFFIVFWSGLVALFFMTNFAEELFDSFQNNTLLSSYIALVGLWVFFTAIRSYLAEVFRGFHDIKMAALYQRILPNVIIVCVIWVLYILNVEMNLEFILWVTLSTNAILVLFALVPFYKKLSNLSGEGSASFKPLLQSSAPIAVGQIFQFVVTQTPLWVLGAVSTAVSIADYGVAFRLAAIISLPLLIANNVIMPHISKFHSSNNKLGLNKLIHQAVTITSILSALSLLGYIVFGEAVLDLFYGEEYRSAYVILIIISCGHVLNVISGSPAIVLAMAGKEVYVFYSSLIAAILTFCMSVYIIPLYGLFGAALATTFGLVILNLILVFFSYKVLGYKTYLSINSIRTTMKRVSI